MDVDLECVEIVFAQKLACGEPATRKRALNTLQDWIKDQSKSNAFKEDDMIRLCKGLHYVMWMQDKMLLQEELADAISSLLHMFNSEDERVLFIKSIFKSLSKEWHNVDRWRMDKFLMLMRRVVRVLFQYLRSVEWKKSIRDKYWKAFQETTITSDRTLSEGLKFHFASLFLDELDNAGALSKKQLTACLQPFADLLSDRKSSDYLFDSVMEEIFNTILHQRSEEIAAMEEGEEDNTPKGIDIDYKALGKMLFEIGKRPETLSTRRKKIYDVVKKFEICAKGGDPYHFEVPEPEMVLTEQDIVDAVDQLERSEQEVANEREVHRKGKKAIVKPNIKGGDVELEKRDFKSPKQLPKTKKTISKANTKTKKTVGKKNIRKPSKVK